jgi:hypothetical protein
MANWKQVTDYDGPTVQINMDNVTHMRRRTGDEITTVYFVSGGGNEVYITVKETPEQILGAQPLRETRNLF